MNKRQKKKQYKKLIGRNPPADLQYNSTEYQEAIVRMCQLRKYCKLMINGDMIATGYIKRVEGKRRKEDAISVQKNLETLIYALSERRKRLGSRKRSRNPQRDSELHNRLHQKEWV